MFRHILVPLDGSSRAEEALPLAAYLARQAGGTLSLLRVVPRQVGEDLYDYSRAGTLADEVHEVLIRDASEYLEHLSHMDILADLALHTEVPTDTPAHSILNYAQSKNIDLIVMCSHGYTGLTRWALGSIAQKIARHSSIPVVILREKSQGFLRSHQGINRAARALVALDGSPLAETVLLPAAQLVAACSPSATMGELHLLRVIKPPSDQEERKYLHYDLDISAYQQSEAERYLHSTRDRLAQEIAPLNIQISTSIIEDTDIATTLIRTAENDATDGYDMIAMATHGRGGIEHWMLGSVTERVLEKTELPLLIVRPQQTTSTRQS
jgi:nucleotide-binding universal stress UspA family protein